MKKNNFKFFGNESYYDHTYFFLNNYEGEAKFIKKLIKERKFNLHKTSLLDIGCGTGNLFLHLKNLKRLVGADISKKLIKIAKNKKINNATFILKDLRYLNLNVKFDIIYISTFLIQTFQDLGKIIEFLNKIKKNLTDKGIIIFSWINELDYSKIYKEGRSERKYLPNNWSFDVITYKINRKRYFKITFYDMKGQIKLSSEALYLILSKELLKSLAKKINMRIVFFENFGLKESYQKWAVLYN